MNFDLDKELDTYTEKQEKLTSNFASKIAAFMGVKATEIDKASCAIQRLEEKKESDQAARDRAEGVLKALD